MRECGGISFFLPQRHENLVRPYLVLLRINEPVGQVINERFSFARSAPLLLRSCRQGIAVTATEEGRPMLFFSTNGTEHSGKCDEGDTQFHCVVSIWRFYGRWWMVEDVLADRSKHQPECDSARSVYFCFL